MTTLAIAAEVSPRHNGDVRTLGAVIRLLRKKALIIRQIEYYHDQAEEVCFLLLLNLLFFNFYFRLKNQMLLFLFLLKRNMLNY